MKLTDIDLWQPVCTDTRFIKSGEVFVALKGPNFDGHQFVVIAEQKGAIAAVVDHLVPDIKMPQIVVPDTLKAFQELGAKRRQALAIPVAAITGSCGKTTTKTMLASILAQRGDTLVTEGNFNNDVGVPQTLLRLSPSHKFAVIEIGASHLEDVANLVPLVNPGVAIITNVAPVHLQGFGGLDGVAKAKGDILDGLRPNGCGILNADDDYFSYWCHRLQAQGRKILSFGVKNKADVMAENIELDKDGHCCFALCASGDKIAVKLPVLGKHNISNALAAAAAAIVFGISLADIKAGLEQMQPVAKRLIKKAGLNGSLILDDSYSANPRSTEAAMEMLANISGKKILVFGYMAELGSEAEFYHRQIGRQAREFGISKIFALGELTKFTVESFGAGACFFADQGELVAALRKELDKDVIVLVKGSHSNKMWQIVEQILG